MPLTQFSASFDPDTLDLLTRAFNAAWDVVERAGPDRDVNDMRQLLAARIFQAYSEGEREFAALRDAALNGTLSH